jgi:hypothetical protein
MYMTVPDPRAGDDRSRPAMTRWLAVRAALLLFLVLLMAALAVGTASAAEAQPTASQPTIVPGPAIPPPPPGLPKPKKAKKDAKPAKHKQGARSSKSQGAKEAKGGSALDLHASCAPLSHTQTYSGWGPAVSYGRPVTVVYEAARCSTPDGSALDLSAEGTAKIFDGSSVTGELLDTRSFLVTGTWKQPKNDAAWPPTWWHCSVSYASYTWQIPGVYTFLVSARDGVWNLNVSSQGVGTQELSWTHDGCA